MKSPEHAGRRSAGVARVQPQHRGLPKLVALPWLMGSRELGPPEPVTGLLGVGKARSKPPRRTPQDEFIKTDASAEGLAKLRPAFKPKGGTVTAGNAWGPHVGGVPSDTWAARGGFTEGRSGRARETLMAAYFAGGLLRGGRGTDSPAGGRLVQVARCGMGRGGCGSSLLAGPPR